MKWARLLLAPFRPLPAPGAFGAAPQYGSILFLVVVWLLAYGARPFLLGFYCDDWSLLFHAPLKNTGPFALARLSFFFDSHTTRPALALSSYFLGALCGESTFRWQIAAAGLTLAAALALRRLLRAILEQVLSCDVRAADLATGLWLLIPWNLGSTAWAISAPSLLAQVWFALSGAVFLGATRTRTSALYLAPGLYALSCLTYEPFYGQFAVLILIGLAGGLWRATGWRHLLGLCVGYGAAQALALAWGRVGVRWFHYAPAKSLQPDWFASSGYALAQIPAELLRALPEVATAFRFWTVGGAIVLCGVAAAYVLVRMVRRQAAAGTYLRLLGVLTACAAGVCLLTAVYAMAGYSVTGRGLLSRTTMSLNVWLAIAVCAILGVLMTQPRWLARPAVAWALGLGVLLFTAQLGRVQEWAASWAIGQRVLNNVPIADLEDSEPDAFILYVVPEGTSDVAVFGAAWDLDAAMKYRYPQLGSRHFRPTVPFWTNEWDGQTYTQACGVYWSYGVRCREMWLWDPLKGVMSLVLPPFRYPPNAVAAAANLSPAPLVRAGAAEGPYPESAAKLTVEPVSAHIADLYARRCTAVPRAWASESLAADYAPAKALDGDRQTAWCLQGPAGEIVFTYREAVRVTQVVIEGRPHPLEVGRSEMITGAVVLNDRVSIPFAGFRNQTAILVDFDAPVEIRRVRVVCERGVLNAGIAEFFCVP